MTTTTEASRKGFLITSRQKRGASKGGSDISAWRIVDEDGRDMAPTWCKGYYEARALARRIGIVLQEFHATNHWISPQGKSYVGRWVVPDANNRMLMIACRSEIAAHTYANARNEGMTHGQAARAARAASEEQHEPDSPRLRLTGPRS
jgi:hypothetical protein